MEFIGDEKNRAIWNQHFIQVKSKIKQPKRTHVVDTVTKRGKRYGYKYADLADVDKAVMDACRAVKDKDGMLYLLTTSTLTTAMMAYVCRLSW